VKYKYLVNWPYICRTSWWNFKAYLHSPTDFSYICRIVQTDRDYVKSPSDEFCYCSDVYVKYALKSMKKTKADSFLPRWNKQKETGVTNLSPGDIPTT
jgi:hypothetical protein